MIFKSLLRRKVRSVLTLVGIGIGIAAIIALGAIADGLEAGFTAMLSGSGADLVAIQADAYDMSLAAVDEEVGRQLSSIPGVAAVAGMIEQEVATDQAPYFVLFGYDLREFAIEHFKIIEGEPLHGPRQVILGKVAAENFDKKVGDSIKFYGSAFRIVGIYKTGSPFEEGAGVISLSDAQALFTRPHQVTLYQLKLKPRANIEEVRQRIERRFPDLTASQSDQFASTQTTIQMVRGFAWAIAFIAILIGGVGMMNTILMSVFERTREIGVLRALGWGKGRVMTLIMGESLTLSLLGGLVGAGLGVGMVKALGSLPATGTLLQGHFSVGLFAQGLTVAVVLGAVGGLYPAWRASQLTPIEALRYEGAASGATGSGLALGPLGGMVTKSLFRRKTRTLLTIVGIGISVAVIVALGGIVDGFVASFTNMLTASEVDLMAVEADISDMGYSAIPERVGKRLASVPGVKYISGAIMSVVMTPDIAFLIVHGYHPAEHAIRHFKIVEGEGLTASHQIILGRIAAEKLNKRVGQTINIFDSRFRVVGIYETGVSWEDGGGVISLREAQALFKKPRQVTFYAIKLENSQDADQVLTYIAANFPEIEISKSSTFMESLPDLQTTNAMMVAISFLIALVGGIGMMNTIFMSVFERTREVGTLRALGWGQGRVLALILQESLLLALVSGVAGIVFGILLGEALTLIPLLSGLLQPAFSPELLARALALALGLGAIGGLYPAWWASRLSPVEALRYE
ncbi:MAG: ABC transporter permease [Anaerolineae bacterium]